jgi:superfamily II DNA helicase RecQ
VRLTEAGRDLRAGSSLELLISDGIVEEFGGRGQVPVRGKRAKAGKNVVETSSPKAAISRDLEAKTAATTAAPLTAIEEALAERIKAWRAAEAKRLRVPAYVVLHDRTLKALAQARPGNPKQLLAIDGMGPAKVEKFGEAILQLCRSAN